MLDKIKASFGVGNIHKLGDNALLFRVTKLEHLVKVIIPHFDNYPLLTQKGGDFLLFKWIILLMSAKENLNINGLTQIINLRASLNKGLSPLLKEALPNCSPVVKSPISDIIIRHLMWLTGFIEGEGCFSILVIKKTGSDGAKSRVNVVLEFQLVQHFRNSLLMNSLVGFLGCGKIYSYSEKSTGVYYKVRCLESIRAKIITFLDQYPLKGVKSLNYNDFKKPVTILESKGHLNPEALHEILSLKSKMNSLREF